MLVVVGENDNHRFIDQPIHSFVQDIFTLRVGDLRETRNAPHLQKKCNLVEMDKHMHEIK